MFLMTVNWRRIPVTHVFVITLKIDGLTYNRPSVASVISCSNLLLNSLINSNELLWTIDYWEEPAFAFLRSAWAR